MAEMYRMEDGTWRTEEFMMSEFIRSINMDKEYELFKTALTTTKIEFE